MGGSGQTPRHRRRSNKKSAFSLLLALKKLFAFYRYTIGSYVLGAAFLFAVVFPLVAQASLLASILGLFNPPASVVENVDNFLISHSRASEPALPVIDAGETPAGAAAPGNPTDQDASRLVGDTAIMAPASPMPGTRPPAAGGPNGQIFIYTIRKGDTISSIANSFGVTVNTILWANSLTDSRSLKVGDQILILPVSGLEHTVAAGDTIQSIARKYRASAEDILAFNGFAPDEKLKPGNVVIVPNGELSESSPITPSPSLVERFSNLPDYEGFYLRPIVGGRRTQNLHGFNGVDLANPCGSAVLAAAEGLVIVVRSSGWNSGYGRYVVIAHSNSTQTLYAHLKEVEITSGQSVTQGQIIGLIGTSGNSTGCHVHFEVRGAKNPFAS